MAGTTAAPTARVGLVTEGCGSQVAGFTDALANVIRLGLLSSSDCSRKPMPSNRFEAVLGVEWKRPRRCANTVTLGLTTLGVAYMNDRRQTPRSARIPSLKFGRP